MSENDSILKKVPQAWLVAAGAVGERYNFHPALALAVAVHESGWGKSALAADGRNNPFGIRSSVTQFREFPTVGCAFGSFGYLVRESRAKNNQCSYEDARKTMDGPGICLQFLEEFGRVYAPHVWEAWSSDVWSLFLAFREALRATEDGSEKYE